MSAQDLEQRARELLASEWEAMGDQSIAIKLRRGDAGMDYSFVAAIHAIVAALRQQPAPVDLEQFRAAICSWREDSLRKSETYVTYTSRTVMAKRVAEADRLLSIIDNAGKVASEEPVAWRVLKIGASGSAFDSQDIRRAYTYEHQPGNEGAWKLGRATSVAATDSAGDYIDRGLSLLNRLQEEGFGVFQIGPVEPMTHQPAPVVDDARMARALDAARCGLSPEHVAAIEEAIAAYDPNCGARTVRVVDDAMRVDAERYRWLRDSLLTDEWEALANMPEPKNAGEFDAAIDAARAQGVQS